MGARTFPWVGAMGVSGTHPQGCVALLPSHFEGGLTLIRAAERATVLADIVRSSGSPGPGPSRPRRGGP
jgi:hypothetical protein